MAADSTYSTVSDIDNKTGDLQAPAYINKQGFANDAADEIDSYLGHFYYTPFNVGPTSLMARPAILAIKRIAANLSTGRFLLAVATASEDDNIHSYGRRLVDEALAALKDLADGKYPLAGAVLLNTDAGVPASGPLISTSEEESEVDRFYNYFNQPLPLDCYYRARRCW